MRTELFWTEGPWTGRLAIVARPRGGEWLEDEVRSWHHAGLNVVVSLLTPDEVASFDLGREADFCQASGIRFVSFPVPDTGTPASRQATLKLVELLEADPSGGRNVGAHCRQGIGRSPLVAACVLIRAGVGAEEALGRLSAARGLPVPETAEQRRWVVEFEQWLRGQPP
jgi:protein-tyrosine phosphatase